MAKGVVTEARLRRRVSFLCDSLCAGRATGTAGATEAAAWIARQLEKAGADVGFQSFRTPDGKAGHNVLGLIPARSSTSDFIVVMAHYDGLGLLAGQMYPGADSDVSGPVAMLSVADMIHSLNWLGRIPRRNVLFVALDGKYHSLSGSEALWKLLASGALRDAGGAPVLPSRISLVVNLDQLGASHSPLKSGREDYLIMLHSRADQAKAELLASVNEREKTGLELAFDYYGSRDFTKLFYERISDQRIFVEHRVPSFMFTSGITMRSNKPHDMPSTLNYPVLKRRIWLIYFWIDRLI